MQRLLSISPPVFFGTSQYKKLDEPSGRGWVAVETYKMVRATIKFPSLVSELIATSFPGHLISFLT